METNIATWIATGVAIVAFGLLIAKVVASFKSRYIKITRADTGDSVILTKPSVEQSRNERSAQLNKLLELMETSSNG